MKQKRNIFSLPVETVFRPDNVRPVATSSQFVATDSPGDFVPSNVGEHLPRLDGTTEGKVMKKSIPAHSFKNVLAPADCDLSNLEPSETSVLTEGPVPKRRDYVFGRIKGSDQRRALLRNPNVPGQLLSPGEVVFAPEPESTTKFSDEIDAGSALNPSAVTSTVRRFSWFVVALLTIIVASSLLFAFSQTANLANEIAALPPPLSWIGFTALAVLWLAIGIAMWQLAATIIRLKRTPGVSLKTLGILRKRAENRKQTAHDYKTAERHIRDFLRNYPNDPGQIRLLRIAGMNPDTVSAEDFLERCADLLRIDNGVPDQWLESVRARIVQPLDDAAATLIQRTALQVGAATAISPRGSVDAMIALAHSYRLVNDLCRLYGVRPGGLETGYILAQFLVAAALAAGGDQAADKLEEQIRHAAQNLFGIAAGTVAARISARFAEGTMNAMLVRRIGSNLQVYICPLSAK